MRKSVMCGLVSLAAITLTGTALADNSSYPNNYSTKEYHPNVDSVLNPYPFKVGMQFDLSTPSGLAGGLEARLPYVPWFKWQGSFTYTLAPGYRFGVLFDPINFPVVPVVDADFGHQYTFKVPGVDNSPSVSFDYQDIRAGLAFGSRDGARFLLLGGMTHLDGAAHNFQKTVDADGVKVGDPTFHGWVPTVKLGAEFLF